MKEFLMLIRENANYGELSPAEMHADIQEHMVWIESLVEKGHFKAGNPLEARGTVVKGDLITDGPFVETKECVSGYYFILAASLEEATEIAKGCPDLKRGSILEIREIMLMDE
ncbi:YciI family protein [Pedobacter sp.]|uniref:YciI family protein n=1 Tax=Pedobacter sp. TaxID=1411316 RepID=UPI00396C4D0B